MKKCNPMLSINIPVQLFKHPTIPIDFTPWVWYSYVNIIRILRNCEEITFNFPKIEKGRVYL